MEAGDLHAPDIRSLFQIFPGEFSGQGGVELVLQGAGLVIAGDMEALARRQRVQRAEDPGMALDGWQDPHVDMRNRGLRGWRVCHYGCFLLPRDD